MDVTPLCSSPQASDLTADIEMFRAIEVRATLGVRRSFTESVSYNKAAEK